jgi:hypothetical protein
MTADVQNLFVHDQIDCVHYPHFDWKFAPYFADDGSLHCMINDRFGHDSTFKNPEYSIYFLNYLLIRY